MSVMTAATETDLWKRTPFKRTGPATTFAPITTLTDKQLDTLLRHKFKQVAHLCSQDVIVSELKAA